jgi:hypothetical protein
MKLTAWVEIGNAAMRTQGQASDAIREALAARQGAGSIGPFERLVVGAHGGIFDTNGNLVGKWEVTE